MDRTVLVALLRQRLMTVLEAMPAAQAGDIRSVHQARVAMRRLREALPVLRASIDERSLGRARKEVRRMTRALGPVRELDVALAHLDALAADNVISSTAQSRLRQAIGRERLERRRAMLASLSPGKMERLRRRLAEVGSHPDVPPRERAIAEARQQVGRRARRLVAAVQQAGSLYLPDRLHNVRVTAKKLRYALEVERELKRSKASARLAQLKRLQDLLGRMHDAEILIDRTRHLQAEIAGTDRSLSAELEALVRTLESECRRDHASYVRRRPSILKLCEALVHEHDRSTRVA